jgi:hypothetical protein
MTDEQDIRGLMQAAEIPPPSVDIAGVVDRGRRTVARRRTTGIAGAAGLALVLVTATVAVLEARSAAGRGPGTGPLAGTRTVTIPTATAPAGQPSTTPPTVDPSGSRPAQSAPPPLICAPTALQVPGGYADVTADVIDPSGHYVGGHATVGENFVPILWTDGVPELLPIDAESVEISAVNAQGIAVGTIESNNYQDQQIFRYHAGVVTVLTSPVPETWNLYPVPHVNAAGTIVVNAEPPGETGGTGSIVIEWAPGATTGRTLSIPEVDDVLAIGDDVLAGGSYPGGIGQDPLVWDLDGGNVRTLSAPQGTAALVYGVAGHFAVGGVWGPNGDPLAALWDLNTGEYTHVPLTGPLTSVNANGWTLNRDQVYAGGPVATLAPLPGTHASGVGGMSIADDGTVAGGIEVKNHSIPVIWHC